MCVLLLQVQKEAISSVEQDGMVFIDEIDKIVVGSEMRYGKTSCSSLHVHSIWWVPCSSKFVLCAAFPVFPAHNMFCHAQ